MMTTAILQAADRAARSIPPLWPLASSVAVNPFLGHTGEPLATATARLRRTAGIALTLPRSWYAARLRSGEIADEDLQAAFDAAPAGLRPKTLAALKQAAQAERETPRALPTVAELARDLSAIDWPRLVEDRISHWASAYYDQGQALWVGAQARSAYAAWRAVATHDLTPEIVGLAGFAQGVADAPADPGDALADFVARLGLSGAALESYFHRLLTTLGGWAQVARHRLWQAELSGGTDGSVTDLLAIRIAWEAALLRQYGDALAPHWQAAIAAYAEPVAATSDDIVDTILQEAAERAAQRRLQTLLAATPSPPTASGRPRLQMAFCIDVRSEVFRRALESVDPAIRTLGFAGFFGLRLGHRCFASDVVEARLPVLLSPTVLTCSGATTSATEGADRTARIAARAQRAWGRFKQAAISSFAFVEAAGPLYAGKLLSDGLALKRHPAPNDPAPRPAESLEDATKLAMAASVLKAMSLTDGFARLVLLAGHGANVVNNPHASALHCGACGGYSGEVNARLLAALLNDREVRSGLRMQGIEIPDDTLFLGALHDTTTDAVTIYADDHPSASHAADLEQAARWLKSAGMLARGERALRLPRAARSEDIPRRARDWAELRPEWGLAGCQAFIAAPRARTAGRDLAGRAFLHDYDWRRDEGFGVLELILTAPVVVASWISLQYYGSSVAPELFGAGNKLLHNVTGGIGVVEGNGGLLRAGLPWQSVHDGEALTHEPLRLSVLIEAPRAAIADILERHPGVRALFDNRWLHLFALDDQGRMAWRYAGNLRWESVIGKAAEDHARERVLA
ncbi:YbcC family protein [Reyranella sp.]|uniref:YbcC family protein n=1 Tax=Reyranella sp. TaxID=1929291 RepID=UPI003C7B0875